MIIKEFLPNPVGKDADGEYIKLFNDASAPILLNGWIIKDTSGKSFELKGNINGGEELSLPYKETKIVLNNNGEQIFLYNDAGKLVDELSYSGQAEEGKIIVKREKGEAISGLAAGEIGYGQLNNNQNNFPPIFFVGFATAIILAGIGIYLVLQLEKKLNVKLW